MGPWRSGMAYSRVCGAATAKGDEHVRVIRRQDPLLLILFIHPDDARPYLAQDLVTNRLQLRGKIIGGDGYRPLLSDQHRLVPRRDGWNVRDIHNREIHADASEDRNHTVVDENTAAIRKGAAVPIRVPDGEHCERRRPFDNEGSAITHRLAERDPLHLHDLSFPGQDRPKVWRLERTGGISIQHQTGPDEVEMTCRKAKNAGAPSDVRERNSDT